MPYQQPPDGAKRGRDMPSGLPSNSGKSGNYPITYGFAGLVLLALGVLVVLRYFYGSIRVEGGVR